MNPTRTDVRLREAARSLFAACTGSPARRLRAQDGGLTNTVYFAEGSDGSYVIRMDPSAAKANEYRKERWAIDHARRLDIPAPKVIAVGTTPDGVSYMLARRERGRPASDRAHTQPVLKQLGQYVRKLHAEGLAGFGGTRDDSTAPQGWTEFLEREFGLGRRLAQLQSVGLVDAAMARRVAGVVRQLGVGREPRLAHGDLRLKNVLVDEAGRISALIDWEFALAAPAPEWDLALALHDLSVDEKDAFIEGYGLDHDELVAAAPALVALNLLHYAPFADAAARTGDTDQLRRFRRRFARAYDLYSLVRR